MIDAVLADMHRLWTQQRPRPKKKPQGRRRLEMAIDGILCQTAIELYVFGELFYRHHA